MYCGLVPIYCRGLELSELIERLEIGICLKNPMDLLDISNLKDRVEVCRHNISEKFPVCWQLEQCLEGLRKLIDSISKESFKSESLIVNLESDYRELRRAIGEAEAERDHLRRELLRVENELYESRLTKERWKRLWMRDY